MLRFGIIDEIDAPKARVRVRFEEDELKSDWLPMMQTGSLKNKGYSLPDVGEHVACMMDERSENGVCMGAVYNQTDTPAFNSADKFGTQYDNGDEFSYDRSVRLLRQKIQNVELNLEADGPTLKNGANTLKSLMVELLDILIVHTHPTGVGPSGPPTEVPLLNANKTKFSTFFKS
jgi:phage baseplate assembly protein V